MIPITQTRTGKDGNCFAACLASILEVPLEEVDGLHENTVNDYLATKGLRYRQVPYDPNLKVVGWSTIEGVSPRGGMHACVARNGKLVWDPHPQDGTGRGLEEPKNFGIISRISKRAADYSRRMHRALDCILNAQR